MKNIIVITTLAMSAIGALAQGQIQFNNLITGKVNAPISMGGINISGAAARATLVGGPTSSTPYSMAGGAIVGGAGMLDSAQPSSGVTWVNFRTGAAAGYVSVGSQGVRAIPNVAFGTTAMLQVAAWTGSATTFADAVAQAMMPGSTVMIGFSSPLQLMTSAGSSDPNIANLVLTGLSPFSVAVVPEPATASLIGLGLASLLIFRRRK